MLHPTNPLRLSLLGSLLAFGTLASTAQGQAWSNNYFLGGLNNTVNEVVAGAGNTIYMAGAFTQANGLPVSRIASFTNNWTTVGNAGGPATEVTALTIRANGNLLTGEVNGTVREWTGTVWLTRGTFNARVDHLTVLANGDVLAAGPFTSPVVGVARFTTAWSALGAGLAGVASIGGIGETPTGDIVVGGSFTPSGMAATSLAIFAGGAWGAFAGSPLPAGTIDALTVARNGDVLAAYRATGPTFSLQRGTAAGWTALAPTMNGATNTILELPDLELMVGGSFSTIGAVTCPSIARFDGTTWIAQANPVNGAVNAIAVSNDRRLVVAGAFTILNGTAAGRAAVRFAVQSSSVTQIFPSCIGANGLVRQLFSADTPNIGTTFVSQASGYATNASLGIEIRGLSQIAPIALNQLLPEGDPNCSLLISPDLFLTIPTALVNGAVAVSLAIPPSPSFLGATLFQQVGAIEPTGSTFVITAGHALAITFGRL